MLEGIKELGEEISEISGCQELGVVIIPPPNGEPFIPPPNDIVIPPPNGEPFIPPPPLPVYGITEWLKKYGLYIAMGGFWVIFIGIILAKKKKKK